MGGEGWGAEGAEQPLLEAPGPGGCAVQSPAPPPHTEGPPRPRALRAPPTLPGHAVQVTLFPMPALPRPALPCPTHPSSAHRWLLHAESLAGKRAPRVGATQTPVTLGRLPAPAPRSCLEAQNFLERRMLERRWAGGGALPLPAQVPELGGFPHSRTGAPWSCLPGPDPLALPRRGGAPG